MNTQPDRYAQLREQLRDGLKTLSESPESNHHALGMALIQIHGAMEDFVRLEIARKAPDRQSEVEDLGKTRWKTLLEYSRQHLGYTDHDTDIIDEANRLRLKAAHGRRYRINRDELVRYAEFVHGKVNPGRALPNLTYRKPEDTTSTPVRPPPLPQPSRKPGPITPELPGLSGRRRSWSWAAALLLGTICLCGIGAISFTLETFEFFPQSTKTSTKAASPTAEAPPISQEATPVQPTVTPTTETICTIVWVEHPSDRLAARNRSMVWEDLVKEQVRGSGMTNRQFYDQVVERNPHLAADGYEFKRGKTYLLPECE